MAERRQPIDQSVLTVVTRVVPGHEPALRAVLDEIAAGLPPRAPAARDGTVPFTRLTTVHFARWVLLPPARDAEGGPIPAELVMVTAYDGPLDGHLRELATVARTGLDAVYVHCEGWADAGVEAYLRRHAVPPAAFFISTRWRTVGQIRAEAALHGALETELDARPGEAAPTPAGIRDGLRALVARTEGLRWALDPPARPRLAWWLGHYAGLVAIAVGLLVLLPVSIPVLVVGLVLLRRAEREDARTVAADDGDDVATELERLRVLTHVEDFAVQNQMTLVSTVKPGRLRSVVLQAVVLYARFRTAYLDTRGTLVGIPSIHFAHWVVIDGGRRLLFVSNYDGTWESYLGDFIDRAAGGLTAIWSNTIGFPRTRFLFLEGARDEQRFKSWVRAQQVASDVWYAAYPTLSVLNVNAATAIRAGLSSTLRAEALSAWLQRL